MICRCEVQGLLSMVGPNRTMTCMSQCMTCRATGCTTGSRACSIGPSSPRPGSRGSDFGADVHSHATVFQRLSRRSGSRGSDVGADVHSTVFRRLSEPSPMRLGARPQTRDHLRCATDSMLTIWFVDTTPLFSVTNTTIEIVRLGITRVGTWRKQNNHFMKKTIRPPSGP
jgi:hypothetical protein